MISRGGEDAAPGLLCEAVKDDNEMGAPVSEGVQVKICFSISLLSYLILNSKSALVCEVNM